MSDANIPPWVRDILDQLSQLQTSLSRLDGRVASLEELRRRESDDNVSDQLSEQLSSQVHVSSSSGQQSQSTEGSLWRKAVENFVRCKQYATNHVSRVDKDPSDLVVGDFLHVPLFSPAHVAAFGAAWPGVAVPNQFSIHTASAQKCLEAIIESLEAGNKPVSLSVGSHGFTIQKERPAPDSTQPFAIRDLRNLVLFLNQSLDSVFGTSDSSPVFVSRTATNLRKSFVEFASHRNRDKQSDLMELIVEELGAFFVDVAAFDSRMSEVAFRDRVFDPFVRTLEESVFRIRAERCLDRRLTGRVAYLEAQLKPPTEREWTMPLTKLGKLDAVVGVSSRFIRFRWEGLLPKLKPLTKDCIDVALNLEGKAWNGAGMEDEPSGTVADAAVLKRTSVGAGQEEEGDDQQEVQEVDGASPTLTTASAAGRGGSASGSANGASPAAASNRTTPAMWMNGDAQVAVYGLASFCHRQNLLKRVQQAWQECKSNGAPAASPPLLSATPNKVAGSSASPSLSETDLPALNDEKDVKLLERILSCGSLSLLWRGAALVLYFIHRTDQIVDFGDNLLGLDPVHVGNYTMLPIAVFAIGSEDLVERAREVYRLGLLSLFCALRICEWETGRDVWEELGFQEDMEAEDHNKILLQVLGTASRRFLTRTDGHNPAVALSARRMDPENDPGDHSVDRTAAKCWE
jgi:hypothetical protein